jgi:hypothetical protein
LSEKKAPRILHISQDASNNDESSGEPGIFALSDEMKFSLCGRTGSEDSSCHKFMNNVIGDALMKSHAKESAWISRENKQFMTVWPCGTPRSGNERTDCWPPSAIRMIAAPRSLPFDAAPITDVPNTDTLEPSFDKTVKITRVGLDDSDSVTSEESDGPFDHGSSARIAEPHDISMGSLHISNVLLHGDRGVPLERFTGQRASVEKYRTFGCLVIVKPPDKRNGEMEVNFRRGLFLGLTGTLLKIYYWELVSQRVKRAYTVKCDKCSTVIDWPSLNSRHICDAMDGKDLPVEAQESGAPASFDLVSSRSPFIKLK